MFQLVKNDFLKNGIFKYADSVGNSIFVRMDKKGNSFVFKFRPVDKNISVEKIELHFPYDSISGVNFQFSYTPPEEKETRIFNIKEKDEKNLTAYVDNYISDNYEILKEAMKILERICIIATDIKYLNVPDVTKLIPYEVADSNSLPKDVIEYQIICNLLLQLSDFEEMKGYASMYANMGKFDLKEYRKWVKKYS